MLCFAAGGVFIFGHTHHANGDPCVGIKCLPACICHLISVIVRPFTTSSFAPTYGSLSVLSFHLFLSIRSFSNFLFWFQYHTLLFYIDITTNLCIIWGKEYYFIVLLICYMVGKLCSH